jgi:predicted secreted protein with PEFG-CTERM motif
MLKKYLFLIICGTFLVISSHHAFAEKNYHLKVDENSFDIKYDFDGDVIAMDVDKESTSLLIGTDNVKDTNFQITLPSNLIRADNNAFAVLVNGYEVDYTITNGENTVLTFFVPDFTEEIEIIGTYVVPEFPLGAILVFGSIFGIIVAIQRHTKFQIR